MNAVEASLYTALTGAGTALTDLLAGTTSFYNGVNPGEDMPAVVFNQMSRVTETLDPNRRENMLYQVKGVSNVSMASAGSIDTQIDTLLHDTPISVAGWTNFWIMRESSVRFTEDDGSGRLFWHAGGIYRIRLTQ